MNGKNRINLLRVIRAVNGALLIVNAAFAVTLAFAGHTPVFSAGAVVFLALVMCFQTFVIRRQRRIDAIADRPRPDYSAIARMEREIYGEAVAWCRSPLCPCGGTLPQHIRSPHYLPGYDAAGPHDNSRDDMFMRTVLRGAIVRPGRSIILPSGQRIDSAEWARRGGRTS